MAESRWLKPKGFADGGLVETGAPSTMKDQNEAFYADQRARNQAFYADQKKQNDDFYAGQKALNDASKAGKAKGGKIAKVVGQKIGRDDGLIPAQVGEYVVKKSAVKKLGTAFLDQINKGRVPGHPLYDNPRSKPNG